MKKVIFILFCVFSIIGGCLAQVITIKHTAYEIHFDTKLKQPIWTHYILTVQHAKKCIGSKISRTSFHKDNLLCANCQVSDSVFRSASNVYDKGHLAPDDDFRWSKKTEAEAMLDSNKSLQVSQFNRGTWKSLEIYVRDIAKTYDVEVFTGVIYGTESINEVLIPTYYWKIIKYNGKVQEWKIPNIKPKSNDNFDNYKTSEKLIN